MPRTSVMRAAAIGLLAAASAAAAQAPPADLPPPPPLTPEHPYGGLWQNSSGSVRVRATLCGEAPCGRVEWASEKAIADATRGGNPDLIGMTVLMDLQPQSANVWRGRVFAPDVNRHFSGTVTRVSETEARLRGCLVGRTLCRTQVWTRVEGPPAP